MARTRAYEERSTICKQTVRLGADEVRIKREFFLPWWSQGEATSERFSFDELSPDCHIETVFTKDAQLGLFGFAACTFVGLVAWFAPGLSLPEDVRMSMLILPFAGVVLLVSTCRKVKKACFRKRDGREAFSVYRIGKQRKHFESMVSAIAAKIRAANT